MLDDNDAFHEQLRALMSGADETQPTAQHEKVRQLTEATRARQEQMKRTVESLQESLDYLRVSVKYLVFDLEATRRENEHLRKLLSQSRGGGPLG